MKVIKKLIITITFLTVFTVSSQQLPQFSQYMYNTIAINPAYAGAREFMVINALNRNQWVGVDGAPTTQTLSVNTALPRTKFGIGLSFINDKLGYENTTYIFSDVSYTLNINDKYWIAFGLKVGASNFSLGDELLNDPQYGTDDYLSRVDFSWQPNFGAGIYFRTNDFYLGLSSPKLVDYETNSNLDYIPINRVSYYFNGGYLLNFKRSDFKFKPTFLLKYTKGAPLSLDLTANFLFYEKLWLGVGYRTNDAVGLMTNFIFNDALSIGYSYDYVTSNLGNFTSGSHEIILSYKFNFPRPKCKCQDLY